MLKYTPHQIIATLLNAGFDEWQSTVMLAIAYAETAGSLDVHTVHVVDGDPMSPAYRSVDWSFVAINDHHWEQRLIEAEIIDPNVTLSQQLLDPEIAAKAARFIYGDARGGGPMMDGFRPWNEFDNGNWLWYISHAEKIIREMDIIQWIPPALRPDPDA